jgi:two-component system cell cycle response regulator DivK
MDIQLPLMDGYKAARRIKSNPEMKEVPIIAVTSYALAGDDAKALRACSCHVAEPCSPRALLAKVRESACSVLLIVHCLHHAQAVLRSFNISSPA